MKIPITNLLRSLPVIAAFTALIASAAQAEPPVKVYILAGQSNMQGKGVYVYLREVNIERSAAALAKNLNYGELPVTGNRGSAHRNGADTFIKLDNSLKKAGLLEDGATLWISYVLDHAMEVHGHKYIGRSGGGDVTLRTADMQEGIGFGADRRTYGTLVVEDGKDKRRRITSLNRSNEPTFVVGRITWGKDGENDSFVPFEGIGHDLVLPEKGAREPAPFNIDQSKISRLVLGNEGQFDEIRVGPTYESVIGAAAE